VEISKRDICSVQSVAMERPDVAYTVVAVDFMSARALHAALVRLQAMLTSSCLELLPSCVYHLSSVQAALRQMSQV
jgi:hypothetical protein